MTLLQRSLRITLPALALVLPLFFLLNFNDTFDLPKLGLVYAVVSVFALWIYGQAAFSAAPRPLYFTGAESALGLFFFAILASMVYSIDLNTSITGFYRVYIFGVLPIASFILLFLISAQEEMTHHIALAIMVGGAAAGLYGALQVAGMEPFAAMPHVTNWRPWSSLGNPVYLGAVCMMALVLTVGEYRRSHYDRFLLNVLAFGQIAGLLLSLSRSAWVGTIAGLLFLAWQQKRKKMVWFLVMIGLVSLLVLPSVRQRATTLFSQTEGSNAARLEGWKGAFWIWQSYPLLGSGPDTFFESFRPRRSLAYIRATGTEVTQAHAHNDFLQFAATTGLVGVATFIILMLVVGALAWNRCQLHPGAAGVPLAAACLALLVQDQFNFSSITTTAWTALILGQLFHNPTKFLKIKTWDFPLRASVGLILGIISVGLIAVGGLSWYADACFKEGQALNQAGQAVNALVRFRESARLRPTVELYQTELGNTARTLAQSAPAGSLRTELFKEAWMSALVNTHFHPRDPDAWNNQGVVAMWRAQLNAESTMPDARDAFTRAALLDPFFVDAWANLAKWHHLNGDLEGEKQLWRKVLQMDPQHPMARAVLGQ